MPHCPYCGRAIATDQVTDEHVIPRALGGGLTPTNPFKVPACKRCNSAAGRWVDGPFIKSFLIHNARALAQNERVDPATQPILPFLFIGALPAWSRQDVQCDMWLGPAGDHVYHFHKPYPAEPSLVGRPPSVDPLSLDPGRVYLAFVATNPMWHPVIVQSARENFPGASLHFLNAGPSPAELPYPPVDGQWKPEVDFIKSRPDGAFVKAQFTLDIGFADRFAAKLALGFGAAVLGHNFIVSPDADLLRQGMWTKEREERARLPIRGTGIFGNSDPVAVSAFEWRSLHTFVLGDMGNGLSLTALFYGKYMFVVSVASDSELWKGTVQPGDHALTWVVAPGLRAFAGPMPMSRYVAEKLRSPPTQDLLALNNRLDAAPVRPPFVLPTSP